LILSSNCCIIQGGASPASVTYYCSFIESAPKWTKRGACPVYCRRWYDPCPSYSLTAFRWISVIPSEFKPHARPEKMMRIVRAGSNKKQVIVSRL
jgi:hypothetical protein